jgi:adenosylhomocysteine nucleosidase
MPREYRPLLRLLDPGRMAAVHGYPSWIGKISGREILVLETGIGVRHATEAARCLVARYSLDLVLSTGFAGGLSPDLRVGDVVWSREVAAHEAVADRIQFQYRCEAAPILEDSLTGLGARPARFVTVERLQSKGHLAEIARATTAVGTLATTAVGTLATTAVVEMESAAVAAVAYRQRIPFLGLRVISDTVSLEIDLDLDAMLDRRGRFSTPRAILAALRRPSVLLSLPRWSAYSRLAGDALADFLVALLGLPEDDLRSPVLVRDPGW